MSEPTTRLPVASARERVATDETAASHSPACAALGAARWLLIAACLANHACSEAPDDGRPVDAKADDVQVVPPAPGDGDQGDDGRGNASGFDNPDPKATMSSIEVMDDGEILDECARETQSAMQVDVDMYIMLDRSSSMRIETGGGQSKWDAIRGAIEQFVQAPQSDGLGVGLQYFPIGVEGVPESCTTDTDCGSAGGACGNRACLPDPSVPDFALIPCQFDEECPTGSPGCAPFGLCEGDDMLACNDFTQGCGPFGACIPIEGECRTYASCDPMDYAQPAVEIGVLPAQGSAIAESLVDASPTGLTPTVVALLGAINHARSRQLDEPTHRVIAVLATDGLPTDCVPEGVTSVDEAVDAVAEEARRGLQLAPAVTTYVIGVFGEDEPEAQEKLDQIAAAGGTDTAFIVDPSGNVSQQFVDALSEIRGGSLACEYQLPEPMEGQELDPMRVNVELTDPTGTRVVAFVGDQSGCGQAELAWYYENAPAAMGGATIRVCENTCDVLKAGSDATVQIVVGCPTQGPE